MEHRRNNRRQQNRLCQNCRAFASWAFLHFAFALIRSTFLHQNDVPSMTDRHLDWLFFNFDFSERGRDELTVLLDSAFIGSAVHDQRPMFMTSSRTSQN